MDAMMDVHKESPIDRVHRDGIGTMKYHYGALFGLPAEQIRFYWELTPEQVEEVRYYYTAGLVNVKDYVYAVKADGHLVVNRERRRWEYEALGEFPGRGGEPMAFNLKAKMIIESATLELTGAQLVELANAQVHLQTVCEDAAGSEVNALDPVAELLESIADLVDGATVAPVVPKAKYPGGRKPKNPIVGT